MAEESFQEKTEKATPRRRKEAREKGEVAKSRELPSVAVMLTALVFLFTFSGYMKDRLNLVLTGIWSMTGTRDFGPGDFSRFFEDVVLDFILLVFPVFIAVFLAAILSNIVQVGFLLSGELIKPKLSKIDPLKGLGRIFSKNSLVELIKSILKLLIISVVAYWSIKKDIMGLDFLGVLDVQGIASYLLGVTFAVFLKCTLAMVVIVGIDYAYNRWEYEKRLKMTRHEIKEEMKKTEGDPQIKARIRSIQMEMARKRMMQDVPKSDVVITNPTHFAVALSYDRSKMKAPKVMAKGAGHVAARIKEIAIQNGVILLENPPLARDLYKFVDVGHEIPAEFYVPVAEILAYVFKIRGKYRGLKNGERTA